MKLFRLTAALAALTLSLAACGGGSSSSNSTAATPAGGSSNISGGTGTPVNVTLADFSIDVSGGTKLGSGTYTFNVTNNGPTGHNLTIEGPGVDNQATPTFTSGTQQLTVTLRTAPTSSSARSPGTRRPGWTSR